MFKIMGGDGREYGPVSATVIRQWVAEGRANGQTRVAAEGTGEWKNLADFPEFADLFAPKPAPAASTAGADNSVPPAASAPLGVPAVPSSPAPGRFMIVGGDGRQYGPVTADEVRQWIADRRANAQTRAQREGTADWKTLAEFPEFAAQFGGWAGGAATPSLRPGGLPAGQPQAALASALVNGPAIFLIVINAVGIVVSLAMLSVGFPPDMLDNIPGMDPAAKKMFTQALASQGPSNVVGLLVASFCLYGAISMMNLRRHAVCVIAAVLTLLPCSGCCCGLGLAAGIWALVVLAKPEVRDAFH
ncbi:hypothetical protein LBMAG56_04030 [Verrucomicrobiota bacterium]|nr:hypothetical protein LBMAG56_04030 [Verrucomicrobiota bacterium]